jgi:hypothetical protein
VFGPADEPTQVLDEVLASPLRNVAAGGNAAVVLLSSSPGSRRVFEMAEHAISGIL